MRYINDNKDLTYSDLLALHAFSDRIKKTLGNNVRRMILFGSKARGTSGINSDIDVLILVNNVTRTLKDQIFDVTANINLEYDVVVSPIIVTTDIYQKPEYRETYFYKATQEEGYIL
jgi:predicted nucleotidyltransferase